MKIRFLIVLFLLLLFPERILQGFAPIFVEPESNVKPFGVQLAEGLGKGLERLMDIKLHQMNLEQKRVREQQAYESIGIPGAIAQFDQEIQCELVRHYMQFPVQSAYVRAKGCISKDEVIPEDIFVQLNSEQIYELEMLRLHRQYLIEQNKQFSPGFWSNIKKGWNSFCNKVKNGFKKLFSRKSKNAHVQRTSL